MRTKKTNRFRLPIFASHGPSAQRQAPITSTSTTLAAVCFHAPSRQACSTIVTSISATPSSMPKTRQLDGTPRLGSVAKPLIFHVLHAVGLSSAQSRAKTHAITSARRNTCVAGETREASALKARCSPRRSAITAPSMPSQRKTLPASSSDQTIG